jgi:hypothetical protein
MVDEGFARVGAITACCACVIGRAAMRLASSVACSPLT